MKHIFTNLILLCLFWIAYNTANGQTSESYKVGSISIDSAKAVRIQTELLKVPVLYALISYKDSIIINRQEAIRCEQERANILASRRNYLEAQTKAKTKRLVKHKFIILGLSVAIIAENYFLFFK